VLTEIVQKLVSIPQWCDCCETVAAKCKLAPKTIVSIPQWCDCCREQPLPEASFGKEFQSHNGAIAAQEQLSAGAKRSEFQSHNGAIAADFFASYHWFQSHNGET
jgi:hypothetical protein